MKILRNLAVMLLLGMIAVENVQASQRNFDADGFFDEQEDFKPLIRSTTDENIQIVIDNFDAKEEQQWPEQDGAIEENEDEEKELSFPEITTVSSFLNLPKELKNIIIAYGIDCKDLEYCNESGIFFSPLQNLKNLVKNLSQYLACFNIKNTPKELSRIIIGFDSSFFNTFKQYLDQSTLNMAIKSTNYLKEDHQDLGYEHRYGSNYPYEYYKSLRPGSNSSGPFDVQRYNYDITAIKVIIAYITMTGDNSQSFDDMKEGALKLIDTLYQIDKNYTIRIAGKRHQRVDLPPEEVLRLVPRYIIGSIGYLVVFSLLGIQDYSPVKFFSGLHCLILLSNVHKLLKYGVCRSWTRRERYNEFKAIINDAFLQVKVPKAKSD